MGKIKNQAILNAIVSYSGASIGFINFIILLPYVFSPEQIGLTRLLQNAASLLVPFAELGIISVVLRWYPFFKRADNDRLSFISYCLGGASIGFVFFSICYVVFKNEIALLFIEKSPLVIDYYYYVLPLVFFIVFSGIFEAVSNSLYKTVFPNFLREVLLRIAVAFLAILFVVHIINFDQFLLAFVFAYSLPLLLIIIYLYKIEALKSNFKFISFSPGVIKEMTVYGLFVILGSSGHLLVSYIDTLMLSSILGLADTGIYVTAFYMAVVIEIPRRSIRQISIPFISDAWEKNDLNQIEGIYHKTSLNQLIIGIYIFLGVWINIDAIFELMPNGEVYKAGKFVVLFVMLGKLIDMGAGVNGEIIALSKHYRFNMYSTILLAIFTVISNLLLIPWLGVTGAALATTISLLLYNLFKYAFLKISLKMEPFNLNTFKILALGLLTFLVFQFFPKSDHPFITIAVQSSLLTMVFGIPLYYLKISEDVNQLLKSAWNSVYKKRR